MTSRRAKGDGPGAAAPAPTRYLLRLLVAGSSPASLRAIENATRLCKARLAGRVELEVIDLRLHPEVALGSNVVAVPVLVRKRPSPIRQVVGDLSDADKVLVGLGIDPGESA